MSRDIRIPDEVMKDWLEAELKARWFSVPIKVDWSELQLTDEQIDANAMAFLRGETRQPHPDRSIFNVVLSHRLFVENPAEVKP